MKYDIAIIGGGPAGYTAAERAAANGLQTVLFEKKAIGGVCLNEGCIPTKTLLYSAKLWDNMKGASKYGISVPDGSAFDMKKIIDRKDKIVKKLTGGVKMTVNSYGAVIVPQEAIIVGEADGRFQLSAAGEVYEVTYLLVCTGSDTLIPPIKGLSEIDYWTSKEALEITTLPRSLVIIGGGVIGMEFASFFNSMGVQVHVVEMMPEILGAMDKETSGMLRSEYQKRGVNFHLNAKVIEVGATTDTEQSLKAQQMMTDEAAPKYQALDDALQKLMDLNISLGNAERAQLRFVMIVALTIIIAVIVAATIYSNNLSIAISKSIDNPLNELKDRFITFAEGDIDSPLPSVESEDEIKELVQGVSAMSDRIRVIIKDSGRTECKIGCRFKSTY